MHENFTVFIISNRNHGLFIDDMNLQLNYVNLITVKEKKRVFQLDIEVFALRTNILPMFFFRVKSNLIHWIRNEIHGKSNRLEINLENFRIV